MSLRLLWSQSQLQTNTYLKEDSFWKNKNIKQQNQKPQIKAKPQQEKKMAYQWSPLSYYDLTVGKLVFIRTLQGGIK